MAAIVYMLRCNDGAYYVGSTRASIEQRMAQHEAGYFRGFAAKRRPVTLVWHQEFERITDAIAAERGSKGWSRAKKEALIRGDWDVIHDLARYRPASTRPNHDE
jgi:predicted GIY-YIG superfamily endonuclease